VEGDLGQPPVAPEPAPFAPGDVVPAFRFDLRIGRGAAPGLFEVSDPRSGKRFVLYEFELSIARLLDGRRLVSEVLESGSRLGIPVEIGGLYKFVRQLWHYGFLAPPGAPRAPASGEGPWPARERWDEATRTLFQTGMRLVRQGRPADAAGYFEAVLDADPGNPEAIEMLSLVGQGTSVAASPIGEERARSAAGVPFPAALEIDGGSRSRPRGRLVLVAAAAGAALAAAVLVPLLRASGPAPRPSGSPAAAVAPSPSPPLPSRSAPVARRWHPTLAEILAPADGALSWEREPFAAVAAGERLGSVLASGSAAPDPGALRRVAELERLAAEDPVYEAFLEKERRMLRRAARGGRRVPIVGAAEGRLETLVPEGAEVRKGSPVARVVDGATWHAGFALPGGPPEATARCQLLGDEPGAPAPCRVVGSTPGPRVTEVTVAVPAGAAPWVAQARSLTVRLWTAPDPPASPGEDPHP
jgi:hypothetical protein